jgi:hypothetical protein
MGFCNRETCKESRRNTAKSPDFIDKRSASIVHHKAAQPEQSHYLCPNECDCRAALKSKQMIGNKR